MMHDVYPKREAAAWLVEMGIGTRYGAKVLKPGSKNTGHIIVLVYVVTEDVDNVAKYSGEYGALTRPMIEDGICPIRYTLAWLAPSVGRGRALCISRGLEWSMGLQLGLTSWGVRVPEHLKTDTVQIVAIDWGLSSLSADNLPKVRNVMVAVP